MCLLPTISSVLLLASGIMASSWCPEVPLATLPQCPPLPEAAQSIDAARSVIATVAGAEERGGVRAGGMALLRVMPRDTKGRPYLARSVEGYPKDDAIYRN